MKALWITFGVIAAVIVISVIAAISIRNGLIERDEQVRENWSQIETQLQRRTDLIPNLVNTVKGYAKHEEKIFSEIAAARSRLLAAKGPAAKAEAGSQLEGVLGRLLAIAENYPNLKASENFLRLQDELAGTEITDLHHFFLCPGSHHLDNRSLFHRTLFDAAENDDTPIRVVNRVKNQRL